MVEGDRRLVRNHPFKALNEDFNEAAKPLNHPTLIQLSEQYKKC